MHGQLKPESDFIMEEMRKFAARTHNFETHPHYLKLKTKWLELVDREWQRLDKILSREEQEQYLAGCETEVAENLEQMSEDMKNG